MRSPHRLAWLAASIAVVVLPVLAVQQIADMRLISPIFLPPPDRVWAALVKGMTSGDLAVKFAATIEHMAVGLLLAASLGITLGAVVGVSPVARAYLGPTLEFLRPLPASAIIPLAIALLGLTDKMMLTVIAFGALWPILMSTIHGFATVEPRLYEVSRLMGLSRWGIVHKIALPNALPDILAGMRFGVTLALVLAVVGEMLASRNGLGLWILLSARSFRSADLFAGVILLGLIGYVSALLLNGVERRLLNWRS